MIITKLDIDEINKALLALQKTKPTKVVENNNVNINTECAFTDAYKQKLDSLENTVIDYSLNEYSNNPVANSILYQRLEAINESIDLLNTNVSTNTTDIESINSAISNINTQINSHSTSIQSIESDITSIENAISNINTSLNNKVDKVTGKGLSTNDFTTAYKTKLDGLSNVTVDSSLSPTSTNPVQNKVINSQISNINTSLNNKVDKVTGKSLSTNDFTNADKTKLDGLHNTVVDTSLSSTSTNPVQNKVVDSALKSLNDSLPYWRSNQWVDLSTLDQNTYYPVVGLAGNDNARYMYNGFRRFKCCVSLNSGSNPSWSTHNQGFSCYFEVMDVFSGYGVNPSLTLRIADVYSFATVKPVSYTQMTNSSVPVFWLRGGGKYRLFSDIDSLQWEIKTATYTVNNQSVVPSTTFVKPRGFNVDTSKGLHISNTNDVNKTYSENDPFVIGSSTALNMAIDNNEIMARNNNQLSTLYLNPVGGDIVLSTNDGGGSETSRTKGNVIQALNKLVIPTSQPANLENGCIWIHPSGV